MCDKWHHNRKDFGSFYLGSLSYMDALRLLRFYGITDAADQDYITACKLDHTYEFLNPPPPTTEMFHKMMLFFNNHGISHTPIPGMHLETIADPKNRFGNSKNWGKYILGLKNPDQFFDNLFQNYHG